MASRSLLAGLLLIACGSETQVAGSGGHAGANLDPDMAGSSGHAAGGRGHGGVGGAAVSTGGAGSSSNGGAGGSPSAGAAGSAGSSSNGGAGGSPSAGAAGGAGGGSSAGAGQAGTSASFNFQTSFDLTESPLSEGGVWHNNGLDWTNVVTSGGLAYGTQAGHDLGPYDDSYAILSGWPADQYAEAVIHIEPGITAKYQEVEILLRWSDSAHYSNGYECNLAFNGSYGVIGRWPGFLGTDTKQYTVICPETASPIGAPQEGDKLAAQIVGYTITSWIIRDGVKHQLCTGTDTAAGKIASGSPGIGFYAAGAPANNKFSFTSFSAHAL